jgi:LPS O-antigen subunit length determinant protein (WzzB/FepE family)
MQQLGETMSTPNKLVDAYNGMLEHLNHVFDHAEDESPAFTNALKQAKTKAVEVNELSHEEVDQIGEYLQRDIHDAAKFMATTEKELADWLTFDLTLIEDKLHSWFSSVADKTSLELNNLHDLAEQSSHYKSGEVTGPGTLVCEGCGKSMRFKKTGHIPPCASCKGSHFKRPDKR